MMLRGEVRWYLAPGGHIGLFIGRQSQAEYWTPILNTRGYLVFPHVRALIKQPSH